MTGRVSSAFRPPSPPDPSLESRPVPRKHRFATRSFGPGAAPDIQQTVTSAGELSRAVQDNDALPQSTATLQADEDRKILENVERENNVDYWGDDRPGHSDPTWGFFLFVTDYALTTTANVPRAVENLLKVQQQHMSTSQRWGNVYSKELYHRLKFDVVEDEEALDGASLDRVQACFRAHVRGLEICPEDDFPGPVRYKVCLVLDSEAVDMLANLAFPEDDDIIGNSRREKLTAVDIYWECSKRASRSYRGAKGLEIDTLAYNYDLIDTLGLESAG